ncbi:MAG: type II secretion system protein [Oscillospiraceae bacterium]
MLKNKRGFSLIELTIVTCIISLIFVLTSFFVISYLKEAKIVKTQANAQIIFDAVMSSYTDIRVTGLKEDQKNYIDAIVTNLGHYLEEGSEESLIASYKIEDLKYYECEICKTSFSAARIYYPKVADGKESVWNNVEYPLGIVYGTGTTSMTEDDYNRKILKGMGSPDAILYNDGINVIYFPFLQDIESNIQDHYIKTLGEDPLEPFDWDVGHNE